MAICQFCHDEYRPLPVPDGRPQAWPEGVCGECLASRIQLALLRPLLGDGQRKPVARVVHDVDLEVYVEEVKRRA